MANDTVARFLGDIQAGRTTAPEQVAQVAKAAGIDQSEVDRFATIPQPVVEWETATTEQHREPVMVPEHLIRAEEQATEDLQNVQVSDLEPPSGSGSNDPASNILATGQEPFENRTAIGHSGQVIDAGSYAEGEDAAEPTSGTRTGDSSEVSENSTKAELQEAADSRGIEYSSSDTKADLFEKLKA